MTTDKIIKLGLLAVGGYIVYTKFFKKGSEVAAETSETEETSNATGKKECLCKGREPGKVVSVPCTGKCSTCCGGHEAEITRVSGSGGLDSSGRGNYQTRLRKW